MEIIIPFDILMSFSISLPSFSFLFNSSFHLCQHLITFFFLSYHFFAQSAGAVECTNCFSAEG